MEKELLKKIRRYEIQIRKAINNQMQGNFHSIFKGSGLAFDDIRPYQYGEDVRMIDWNASAKGHGTYIRTYKEEKEQTIFFMLDVSASQNIGREGKTKFDVSKEICGVLALSGAKETNQLGLICYSDVKEKYIKPKKGLAHAHEIIYEMIRLNPKSKKTNLGKAISFAMQAIKRKSVVIMVSDFIDENYFSGLKALAQRHDLILIHISDTRETNLPQLGIVPTQDKESKRVLWVNTSFKKFRNQINKVYIEKKRELVDFSKKNHVNFLSIDTQDDYVIKLLQLFKIRNKYAKEK